MSKPIIYISYGRNVFKMEKFDMIKNDITLPKPSGGIWACRKSSNDWYKWVVSKGLLKEDSNYLKLYVEFRLRPGANIYKINSKENLKNLIKQFPLKSDSPSIWGTRVDWEKASKVYDGFEVTDIGSVYMQLYTWDMNSILICNPSVIEIIE